MAASPSTRPGTVVHPALLTAVAVAVGIALATVFPLGLVALYAGTLPVALILLWVGRDVQAPIDRILAVDAARSRSLTAARDTQRQQLSRAA